ncbi:histidinol-phosphatase HisJ family protein [Candidatus Parcubacteria bacterium]|nr:histidinol-phosphatase HisJ family protein [Candidatus Parcubacteria bacterium]
MFIDSHVHTHYSHGDSEVYKVIKDAIEKGLDGVGFAEHFHYDFFNDLGLPTIAGKEMNGIVFENFKIYYKTVERAREEYKDKIKILLGVEVDYLEAKKYEIKESLDIRPFENDYKEENPKRKFEFDFIMGASHFIGNPLKYFSDYRDKGEDWMIEEYFQSIKDTIKSGLFDIIAHPEIIKYFINKDFNYYSQHIEDIVDLLVKYNVAIDLNTDYCLNKETKKFEKHRLNPSIETLVLCKEKDIPLVIGSDAHSPSKMTNNFTETFAVLKNIGIKNLFYFEKRKLIEYTIDTVKAI